MRDFMAIAKALADPSRVRLLLALEGRELCVCQLIALLSLAPSTVSKHLSILHQAGLIAARKSGKWIYYRQAELNAPVQVREALGWVRRSLVGDKQIGWDAQRVKELLLLDTEELCRLKFKN